MSLPEFDHHCMKTFVRLFFPFSATSGFSPAVVKVSVRDSRRFHSDGYGLKAQSTAGSVTLSASNNIISNNSTGIGTSAGGNVWAGENIISGNRFGLINNGIFESAGNNAVREQRHGHKWNCGRRKLHDVRPGASLCTGQRWYGVFFSAQPRREHLNLVALARPLPDASRAWCCGYHRCKYLGDRAKLPR